MGIQPNGASLTREQAIELFSDFSGGMAVPPKVILYLGLICNLSCPYCYLPYKTRMPDEMPIEEILDKLKALGARKLEILGGEPLIYKNRLLYVLKFAKENHMEVDSISTNGLIYDSYVVEILKSVRVNTFQVSLDSTLESTYGIVRHGTSENFKKVKINIARFVSDGLPVCMSFVLLKQNIDQVKSFVELASNMHVKKVDFGTFTPIGEGIKVWDWSISQTEFNRVSKEVMELRKMHPEMEIIFNGINDTKGHLCEAGTSEVAVFPNGDLYPCGLFTGLPSQKIGNIRNGIDSKKLRSIFELENPDAEDYRSRCVACKISDMERMAETMPNRDYSLNPSVSMRTVKTGLMIYLDEKIFSINEIGAVVIKSIQKRMETEQIIASIAAEYREDHNAVARDVESFIKSMLKKGILITN